MLRVYLAGPMTGHDDYNAPAFAAAAELARGQGWKPVNPHDTDPAHPGECPGGERHKGHPNTCWMRASLKVLLTCDRVLMLPGWAASAGAALEHTVAERCGLPIHYLNEVT